MKSFFPIIIITLLNLFSSVSSLPMYSSGSKAPANADTTLAHTSTPRNIGEIFDVVFYKQEGVKRFSAGIYMGMEDNMFLFLSLCTGYTRCIPFGTLPFDMSRVLGNICPPSDATFKKYTGIGDEFRAVVPDIRGMKIQKVAINQESVPGLEHVDGVTRLVDDVLAPLLDFVNERGIKTRPTDTDRIARQLALRQANQPTGAGTSLSASVGSQLRVPTDQHTGAGTSQSASVVGSRLRVPTSLNTGRRSSSPYDRFAGRASSSRPSTHAQPRTPGSSPLPAGQGVFHLGQVLDPIALSPGLTPNKGLTFPPSGHPPGWSYHPAQAPPGGVVLPPGPSLAQGVAMGNVHLGMFNTAIGTNAQSGSSPLPAGWGGLPSRSGPGSNSAIPQVPTFSYYPPSHPPPRSYNLAQAPPGGVVLPPGPSLAQGVEMGNVHLGMFNTAIGTNAQPWTFGSSPLPAGQGGLPSGSSSRSNSAVPGLAQVPTFSYYPPSHPPPRSYNLAQAPPGGVVLPPVPKSYAQDPEMGDWYLGVLPAMTDEELKHMRFLTEHKGFRLN